jgi:uncharacterized protein
MRLDGERDSANIDDRRGRGGLAIGGGLGGVVLLLVGLFFGVDLGPLVNGGGESEPSPRATQAPGDDAARQFVGRILASTEDVWSVVFQQSGRRYEAPILVLFSGATRSSCGAAEAAMGPFYCPEDRRVYIDLEFLADLQRKLGAKGDFAAAYVIAHEVGHHVQNQLGVLDRAASLRGQGQAANATQVRIELMADCLAGIWANRADQARGILERGDVEEGLNAAAAVGDDRIQRQTRGTVVPESFTHGSSAQRVQWFRRGLERGEVRVCDTFAG